MSEPQGYGSEPVSQPPPAAPMPAPVAPVATPPPRTDVSKPGLVIAVIALALALIGMVAFPGPVGEEGPQGEAGPQGSTGDDGDDGSDGNDGAQGPTGPQGPSGADGADGADGAQGPTGPQGPPGPGSLMAFDTSSAVTTIGSACTAYAAAVVTITVPSEGYVVVSAQVQLRIDHTFGIGNRDAWVINVGSSTTDCDGTYFGWFDTVEDDAATDPSIERSAYAQRWFAVTPGTYDYYIVGQMIDGQNAGDLFYWGNMFAVFYPS